MLERLWDKGNSPALLVGVKTDTVALDVIVAISQKIRKQHTSRPRNTTFGLYPKDAQLYHKDMCSTMVIAVLFVIARTWKQPKCPQPKNG